jgi:hypothetical protein
MGAGLDDRPTRCSRCARPSTAALRRRSLRSSAPPLPGSTASTSTPSAPSERIGPLMGDLASQEEEPGALYGPVDHAMVSGRETLRRLVGAMNRET